MAKNPLPNPMQFTIAGWKLVKRHPAVFVARVASDFFTTLFRLTALFVFGLFFAVHFGNHIEAGGTLMSWVPAAVARFTSPSMLASLAGYTVAAWAIGFVVRCAADAGIWGTLAGEARGEQVRGLRSFLGHVSRNFGRATAANVTTFGATITLVTMMTGVLLSAPVLARVAESLTGSAVVVPALVLAAPLALVFTLSFAARLTAEFVPAPLFLGHRMGLGDALIAAARAVLRRPVYVYRLFVHAASILIVPLFLYWAAVMVRNIAYELPALMPLAQVGTVAAEVVVVVGVAGFVLMLHATFFAYHAWSCGILAVASGADDERTKSPKPTLTDFLPGEYPNIIDVDELIGSWPQSAPSPKKPVSAAEDRRFDLGAILIERPDDEESE